MQESEQQKSSPLYLRPCPLVSLSPCLLVNAVVWLDGLVDLNQSPQALQSAVLLGSSSLIIRLLPLNEAPPSPLIRPLTERLGIHRTMEYLLTGFEMTATEAFALRLIDGVMTRDKFENWLARVNSNSSQSQQLAAELLSLQPSAGRSAAEAAERYGFALAFALPDAHEGIRAFLEKRTPCFSKR